MPAYTEEDIIKGCRKQDRAIQEYLYKNYYSQFLKICARYAKNMPDAEQLLNDGFLRIFTNIGKYAHKGSFEGWMKRILVNTCIDYLRSAYLKSSLKMQMNTPAIEESTIAVSNTGLDQLEFKELLQMILSLPLMSRIAFNLFVFESYSHKEIAKELDITESTSSWHVHNARTLLREQIKKNDTLKKRV